MLEIQYPSEVRNSFPKVAIDEKDPTNEIERFLREEERPMHDVYPDLKS